MELYSVLCKVHSASLYIMYYRLLLVFRDGFNSKQTVFFVMFGSDEKTEINAYRQTKFVLRCPPCANCFQYTVIIKVLEYLCQCINQHELLTLYAKLNQHMNRMTMVFVVIAAIFTTKGKVEKADIHLCRCHYVLQLNIQHGI